MPPQRPNYSNCLFEFVDSSVEFVGGFRLERLCPACQRRACAQPLAFRDHARARQWADYKECTKAV